MNSIAQNPYVSLSWENECSCQSSSLSLPYFAAAFFPLAVLAGLVPKCNILKYLLSSPPLFSHLSVTLPSRKCDSLLLSTYDIKLNQFNYSQNISWLSRQECIWPGHIHSEFQLIAWGGDISENDGNMHACSCLYGCWFPLHESFTLSCPYLTYNRHVLGSMSHTYNRGLELLHEIHFLSEIENNHSS